MRGLRADDLPAFIIDALREPPPPRETPAQVPAPEPEDDVVDEPRVEVPPRVIVIDI